MEQKHSTKPLIRRQIPKRWRSMCPRNRQKPRDSELLKWLAFFKELIMLTWHWLRKKEHQGQKMVQIPLDKHATERFLLAACFNRRKTTTNHVWKLKASTQDILFFCVEMWNLDYPSQSIVKQRYWGSRLKEALNQFRLRECEDRVLCKPSLVLLHMNGSNAVHEVHLKPMDWTIWVMTPL